MKIFLTVLMVLVQQQSPPLTPPATYQPPAPVTSRAIWGPGMSVMQEIRDACGQLSGSQFGECFLSMMQKTGASLEAVAFARLTDNLGYMRDFREAGPVDVAFVHFPFRANENQGAYLVNGLQPMIDIDNVNLLANYELTKNLSYSRLARLYPQISVWPGDRSGTNYIVMKKLPVGGVRFVPGYILRNGCRACDVLGNVTFAFDFDRSGRFLGTKLMNVTKPRTAL